MGAWQERPVLVYGPRKGGTTLLQSLLDGGERYLMLPGELKLKFLRGFDSLDEQEKLDRYIARGRSVHWSNGLRWSKTNGRRSLVREGDGPFKLGSLSGPDFRDLLEVDEYLRVLGRSLQVPSLLLKDFILRDLEAFRSTLALPQAYAGWACKEVGGRLLDSISRFEAMFPDGKFVFIARDPRFVVRSIILERRRRGIQLGPRKIVKEWLEANRILRYFAEVAGKPDCVLVLYEDLVKDTVREMTRVTSFLGIPFDPVYTVPTTLGIKAKVKTSSKDTTEVFDSSTRDWESDLRPAERRTMRACIAADRLQQLLGRPGYQDYSEFTARHHSRVQ